MDRIETTEKLSKLAERHIASQCKHRWETSCGRCSYESRGHYEWCPQCGREVVYDD